MATEILLGRDEFKNLLVVVSLAHEEIEELGSFIPPMPEQLRVVRREDERRAIEDAGELFDLFDARFEKMIGVPVGGRAARRGS